MTQENKQTNSSDELNSDILQDGTDRDEIPQTPEEIGGPSGLEPTRYGDWERKGRCIDF